MRRRITRLGAVFGLLMGAVTFGTPVSADIPIGVAVTTTDTNLCHTYEYGAVCIDAFTASGGGAIFTYGTRTGTFFGDAFTHALAAFEHEHVRAERNHTLDDLGIAKTAREEKMRARDAKLKQDAENARMAALYRKEILKEKVPESGFVPLGSIGVTPAMKKDDKREAAEPVMGD